MEISLYILAGFLLCIIAEFLGLVVLWCVIASKFTGADPGFGTRSAKTKELNPL